MACKFASSVAISLDEVINIQSNFSFFHINFHVAASVSLRYGYYGDCRMVLGPSSSRLIEASSLFVRRVEVRDDSKKEILLYGFSEKPQLTHETNWTVTNFLIVGSYSRKVAFQFCPVLLN